MAGSEVSDAQATYATSSGFDEEGIASTEAPDTEDLAEEMEELGNWETDDDEWVVGPSLCKTSSSSSSSSDEEATVPPAGGGVSQLAEEATTENCEQ